MLWLKEMSSHLKGTPKPQFDTSYWCIFRTHPHWKAVQGTQLLLTQMRMLLGEGGEELLGPSKQPPTTCSHCTRTKLRSSDRLSVTFMPFSLCWHAHSGKRHSDWKAFRVKLHSFMLIQNLCNGLEENISFLLNRINLCYSSSLQSMCSFAFSPPNLQPGHKAKAFTPCAKARERSDGWMCTDCITPLSNDISFFLLS